MTDDADGTYAALSLLGRSLGFDRLPLPHGDSDGPPLLDVPTAVEGVCRSLDAPRKLNLLSHCCPRVDRAAVEPIARSLIREDDGIDAQFYAADLLDRAYGTPPGADPYGRPFASRRRAPGASTRRRRAPSPVAGAEEQVAAESVGDRPDQALVQEAQNTLVSLAPACTATTQLIGGVPTLSLSTTVISPQRFEDAQGMTNPLSWSQCEPQSLFFKEMKVLGDQTPLPYPDHGWRARILEVVDFSYGYDESGESAMSTELDFVYFESDRAAGCTYDLHRSHSREILVDRGFVMVEDLKSLDLRRTTTLKQVYFRNRSNPGDVCRYWSLAHGMVRTCSPQRQPA